VKCSLSTRWCARVARGLIRATYYTCAFLVRWVLRLCHAPAPVTSTVMGSNHSLGQLSVAHPDVIASPEAETEEGEATVEEQVVEDILEDVEVGMEGSVEDREVELSERVDVAEDTRLECWDWPHNWEDLDWDEAMWVEDETVSADIEEAVLSDELWE